MAGHPISRHEIETISAAWLCLSIVEDDTDPHDPHMETGPAHFFPETLGRVEALHHRPKTGREAGGGFPECDSCFNADIFEQGSAPNLNHSVFAARDDAGASSVERHSPGTPSLHAEPMNPRQPETGRHIPAMRMRAAMPWRR